MKPMRPGIELPRLDEYTGTLPEGWVWQGKLNDERATIYPDGRIENRHGAPFTPGKLAKLRHAIDAALREHSGQILDVALVGIREPSIPPRVVVLDLPQIKGPFAARWERIALDFRLPCYDDARQCWADHVGKPGYEGIVGRRKSAGYEFGNSKSMMKSKWRLSP